MTVGPSASSLTLATFNIHMGIDGWGRPFDAVAACAQLEAHVMVIQESWSPGGGRPSTVQRVAAELGYDIVAEVPLARGRLFDPLPTAADRWGPLASPVRKSFRLDDEHWGMRAGPADRAFTHGSWGLGLLSRVPFSNPTVIDLGKLRRDAARRAVIHCDIDVGGVSMAVYGTHMSHITHGSHAQYRRLSRQLPPPSSAAVLAGDMNLWGPPVSSYFRGWRRALRARTWPAHRPHSQLDHVLVTPAVRVLDAYVGDFAGSDHRPVVVRLEPV
jgi:endonuclease/exonuclease/phosphatase family metal-dependent hydrolase